MSTVRAVCPTCNSVFLNGERFCQHDGTTLTVSEFSNVQQQQQIDHRQKWCPVCRASYPPDKRFCATDGSKLLGFGESPTSPPQQQQQQQGYHLQQYFQQQQQQHQHQQQQHYGGGGGMRNQDDFALPRADSRGPSPAPFVGHPSASPTNAAMNGEKRVWSSLGAGLAAAAGVPATTTTATPQQQQNMNRPIQQQQHVNFQQQQQQQANLPLSPKTLIAQRVDAAQAATTANRAMGVGTPSVDSTDGASVGSLSRPPTDPAARMATRLLVKGQTKAALIKAIAELTTKFSKRGMDLGIMNVVQKEDGTFAARVEVGIDHNALSDRVEAAIILQSKLRRRRPRLAFLALRLRIYTRIRCAMLIQAAARRRLLQPMLRLALRRTRNTSSLSAAKVLQAVARRRMMVERRVYLVRCARCLQSQIRRRLVRRKIRKTDREIQQDAVRVLTPYLARMGYFSLRYEAAGRLTRFVKALISRQGVHRLVMLLRRAKARSINPSPDPSPPINTQAQAQQLLQAHIDRKRVMEEEERQLRMIRGDHGSDLTASSVYQMPTASASVNLSPHQQPSPTSTSPPSRYIELTKALQPATAAAAPPPSYSPSDAIIAQAVQDVAHPIPYSPPRRPKDAKPRMTQASTGISSTQMPVASWDVLGSMSQPIGGNNNNNNNNNAANTRLSPSKVKPSFNKQNSSASMLSTQLTTQNASSSPSPTSNESYASAAPSNSRIGGFGARNSNNSNNNNNNARNLAMSPPLIDPSSTPSPSQMKKQPSFLTPTAKSYSRSERDEARKSLLASSGSGGRDESIVLTSEPTKNDSVVRAIGSQESVIVKRTMKPKNSM